MAYKEKDTKKWTAQWFETNARGEKKKRRKRGFETKREALEYERQKKLNNSRSMLDKMYDMNREYFRDLTVYIMAGKEKLETEREVTLLRLKEKAEVSGQAEDAQRLKGFSALLLVLFVGFILFFFPLQTQSDGARI